MTLHTSIPLQSDNSRLIRGLLQKYAAVFAFIGVVSLQSQVLSTTGTVSITNTVGTVVTLGTGGAVEVNGGGTLTNHGTFSTMALTNAGALEGNGTYTITGAFTNSGTFTAGSSTVDYANTAGGQTVIPLNYHNLTISNTSNTTTLTGSIGVKGTFSPSAGALTSAGTSTVNFNNSSGGQTVPAFLYHNLTVSNGSGVTTLSGTVGVANLFTPSGGGLTSAGTSNVDLNGSAAQSIPSFTYHDLTLTAASAVTKTMTGAVTVNNDLTVTANNTLDDGGNQLVGNGTGTFSMAAGSSLILGTAGTATLFPTNFITANIALDAASVVVYNSDQLQAISAAPVYGYLTLTAGSAVTKTVSGAVTVATDLTVGTNNTLNVTGSVQINTGALILNGTLDNSGIIEIGL